MTVEFVYTPGNSTRYWIVVGTGEDDVPFVALPDFGSAAVMDWRLPHPDYVRAKLRLGQADADAVADALDGEHLALCEQLGVPPAAGWELPRLSNGTRRRKLGAWE